MFRNYNSIIYKNAFYFIVFEKRILSRPFVVDAFRGTTRHETRWPWVVLLRSKNTIIFHQPRAVPRPHHGNPLFSLFCSVVPAPQAHPAELPRGFGSRRPRRETCTRERREGRVFEAKRFLGATIRSARPRRVRTRFCFSRKNHPSSMRSIIET